MFFNSTKMEKGFVVIDIDQIDKTDKTKINMVKDFSSISIGDDDNDNKKNLTDGNLSYFWKKCFTIIADFIWPTPSTGPNTWRV